VAGRAKDEQGALCHNIDKVRAAEVKQMEADSYEPLLKGSRWLLLKRPENREAIK